MARSHAGAVSSAYSPAAAGQATIGLPSRARAMGEIHDPHQAEDQRQADAEKEKEGRL